MSETAGSERGSPASSEQYESRSPIPNDFEEASFEDHTGTELAGLQDVSVMQLLTEQIEKDVNAVHGPGHIVHPLNYKDMMWVMVYRSPLFDDGDEQVNAKNIPLTLEILRMSSPAKPDKSPGNLDSVFDESTERLLSTGRNLASQAADTFAMKAIIEENRRLIWGPHWNIHLWCLGQKPHVIISEGNLFEQGEFQRENVRQVHSGERFLPLLTTVYVDFTAKAGLFEILMNKRKEEIEPNCNYFGLPLGDTKVSCHKKDKVSFFGGRKK
ncbi:hypothetical protein K491DRAFT_781689 [Lophiostoma macrostomum CBS 122681]|uniref:Uncharacterized protein n=1 Tax=Lophiostoma macrostomum CBS 122681 TaxID=1314788 RepID=A0A6A6SVF8_9PLEO|nr:hypothetical protein K491DRAFT_781689 [Lophiostoma macrostomum CBS 122681]